MSWKRAQGHAESMLTNLGVGPKVKGKRDLRGKKLLLVDDEANPYRTMCFALAAKMVKSRGGDVETRVPTAEEVPHAKLLGASPANPASRERMNSSRTPRI
ncbi:MAG TPA: hypothetical protein VGD78_14730 [Chthoniobacterales bacterium]